MINGGSPRPLHSVCLWIALAMLVASMGITDHYLPWTAFHGEVLGVGFAVLVVVWAVPRLREVRAPRAALFLLACAAIPWFQWSSGHIVYLSDAMLASLFLAGAAVMVWAAYALPQQDRQTLLRAILLAMLVAAIWNAVSAVYQWTGLRGASQLLLAEGNAGQRASGNIAQANQASTLFLFGVLAAIELRSRGALRNWTAGVLVLSMLIGMALTQSRVPWLACGVVAAWVVARRSVVLRAAGVTLRSLLLSLAAYALAYIAVALLSDVLFSAPPVDADASRLGGGRRPVLWLQWWNGMSSFPWWGAGWLQGVLVQTAGASAAPGEEAAPYFHNVLMDLVAWNGWPLGLAISAVMLGWLLAAGRRASHSFELAAFTGVLLLFSHSLVEYPYAYTYFLLPVAAMAGCLLAGAADPAPASPLRVDRTQRTALLLLALACAGATVAVTRDYLRVEPNLRTLREQVARIGGTWTSEPVEDLWVLDSLEEFSRAARVVPRPEMRQEDLQLLARAAQRFPNLGMLQLSALALASNGRPGLAHEALQKICVLYGDKRYALVLARMQELAPAAGPGASSFVEAESASWAAAEPMQGRQLRCMKR